MLLELKLKHAMERQLRDGAESDTVQVELSGICGTRSCGRGVFPELLLELAMIDSAAVSGAVKQVIDSMEAKRKQDNLIS